MTRRLLTLLLCLATLLPCIALAQDQFKVLVVAIPNRYHHDYTVVAKPQFERMAQRHGVDLTWSWNSAPFDGDLSPFGRINPCGYAGLQTVDLSTIGVHTTWDEAAQVLAYQLSARLAP